MIGDFYRFIEDGNESENFHCDDEDHPMELQLKLSETLYPCLFFSLLGLPCLLTSRGRSSYLKLCLISIPLCYLWMEYLPPSKQSRQSNSMP